MDFAADYLRELIATQPLLTAEQRDRLVGVLHSVPAGHDVRDAVLADAVTIPVGGGA